MFYLKKLFTLLADGSRFKKGFFSLTSVLVYGEIAAETKLLIQRICLSGHNPQRDPPMAQSQNKKQKQTEKSERYES